MNLFDIRLKNGNNFKVCLFDSLKVVAENTFFVYCILKLSKN